MVFSSGIRLIGTITRSPLHEIDRDTAALTRIDNEPELGRDLRVSTAYDPDSEPLPVANNWSRAPDGIEQFNFGTGLFETRLEFDRREAGYPGIAYRKQVNHVYGISPDRNLDAINPDTGAVETPVPLSGDIIGIVGSLVFLPDGTGLTSAGGPKLSELDPHTGIVSNSIDFPPGFLPKAMAVLIPEPSSGLWILFSPTGAIIRRNRQSLILNQTDANLGKNHTMTTPHTRRHFLTSSLPPVSQAPLP